MAGIASARDRSLPHTQMNIRYRLPRLLPALLAYLLALALFVTGGEADPNRRWLVRGLWLAGMLLLMWGQSQGLRLPRPSREDGRDLLILTAITAAGFWLRFWRLPDLPNYFHGDIASQGLQALAILEDAALPWFGVGWSDIPMLDFQMMAGTMRLFGSDLFGLSMTAVWQGVLTIPALYLLGRELYGRRPGLLAATLAAISYTHIHFSRIVTTASPLLFITFTYFFLFRGLRQQAAAEQGSAAGQRLSFTLAGLSLGVGLLVYFPIRINVMIVTLLFLWLLLWQRQAIVANRWGWLAFILAALVGFGPMLGFVFQDFTAFVGRGDDVTLWNPLVMQHLTAKYGAATEAQVWIEQIKRSFLTFFYYPDSSTHFGFPGPMVDRLTAFFLLVGLAVALRRWRDVRFFLPAIWLLSTLILGSVITNDPPFWPHIVILLPAVWLLAALGMDRLWRAIAARLPSQDHNTNELILALLCSFVLLIAGVRNWQAYQAHAAAGEDVIIAAGRYLAGLPRDHFIYITPEPLDWQRREIAFLAAGLQGANLSREQALTGAFARPEQPIAWIITPNHADLLPALQERFPAATPVAHRTAMGRPAFTSLSLRPAGDAGPAPPPAGSLARRQRLVWALAGLIFLLAGSGGLLIRRRRPPAPQPAPDLAPLAPAAIPSHMARVAPPPTVAPGPARSSRVRPAALLLLALALILAYLGQHFFDGRLDAALPQALIRGLSLATDLPTRQTVAVALYLAAMCLYALAAPGWRTGAGSSAGATATPSPRGPRREHAPDARVRRYDRARAPAAVADVAAAAPTPAAGQKPLLILALLPALAGLFLFQTRGETATVRWLWLASILLFLAGQTLWPLWRGQGQGHDPSPPFRRLHILTLLLILAAGFYLRFDRLETIPHDLHGDMASMGLQARDWLSWENKYLFREGWANIPLIGFLPAAFFLRFFGNDLFALNLSALTAGMLTLLATYLLVWRLFDSHRLAALAAAILAINTPHIHFSRLAAYMDPWPFHLFALALLVDGLRSRRPVSLALAGLLLGFGLQMYYSGRVILFILALAFLYLFLCHRRWLADNLGGIGLCILGGLIALGPSLLYFGGNYEALAERSRSVFLFYEPVMAHLFGKYGVNTQTAVVLEQIKRSLLMFNHAIDSSTQFGYPYPMFSSLIAPLVVLGAAVALRRWRQIAAGLILIFLVMNILFGSILTNNAPFWPRLVGVLPAAAILAALALDRAWAAIAGVFPGRKAVPVLLAAGALALIGVAGWRNYALYTATVSNNARAQAFIGRFLYDLPPEIAACDFTDPFALHVRETAFLAYPRALIDLPADAPDGLIVTCPGPPFVWILYPNQMHRLPLLQARWPGGVTQEHYYGNGGFAFTSYLVSEGPDPAGPSSPAFTSPLPTPPGETAGPGGPVSAYEADGRPFAPDLVFMGATSSSLWQIDAGVVQVQGGQLSLRVGSIPGHDAVYDYVELTAADGRVVRFEAEDEAATTGGAPYAGQVGQDGRWWRQDFGLFSGGQGLVAQGSELTPVLTTTLALPDGEYRLTIGSFTGDPHNGVFALGVGW